MRPAVLIGADHAGWDRKQAVAGFLREHGYEVEDISAAPPSPDDDYPDVAAAVARRVARGEALGVLLCGNAEGICIAANKVRGVRAGVGYSDYAARTMREDDDANILCLPGRVLSDEEVFAIALRFLTTRFSGAARHVRRIGKVKKLEESE